MTASLRAAVIFAFAAAPAGCSEEDETPPYVSLEEFTSREPEAVCAFSERCGGTDYESCVTTERTSLGTVECYSGTSGYECLTWLDELNDAGACPISMLRACRNFRWQAPCDANRDLEP